MSNFRKIIGKLEPFQKICAVAFLVFATISCIATAQSLSLTLGLGGPQWLIFVIAFIFAFGLYLLTSYCFKLIIDSQNYKFFMPKEDRRRSFVLGILGVILFWIVCSMPTNTHSLLYTKVIDKVVVAELDNQRAVFDVAVSLTDKEITEKYYRDLSYLESSVNEKKALFINEINNTNRIGLGPEAKAILADIQVICGKSREEEYYIHTTQKSTSVAERTRIKNHYEVQIDNLLKWAKNNLKEKYDQDIATMKPKKDALIARIDKIDGTKTMLLDKSLRHSLRIKDARIVIDDGYNQPDYRDQILDQIEVLKDSKEGHRNSNVMYYKHYKAERLHSVFKVWGDFLSKKMQNLDFDMLYWIVISIIIDIAGLAFFGIAFRRKE
jgi:hypothetical protein